MYSVVSAAIVYKTRFEFLILFPFINQCCATSFSFCDHVQFIENEMFIDIITQ